MIGAEQIVAVLVTENNIRVDVSMNLKESNISVDLLIRRLWSNKENISSLDSISIQRQPNNMRHVNAVAMCDDRGGVIGPMARDQAVSIMYSRLDVDLLCL